MSISARSDFFGGSRIKHWQFNELEDSAFDDLYHSHNDGSIPKRLTARAVTLYLRGIRKFMDYSNGEVGVRRKVSYQMFRELLEEPVYACSAKAGYFPTIDQIRWYLSELERVGLILRKPKSRKTDPLVFFLPLADSDLVRSGVDPQQTPKGRVPKVLSITAGVSGGMTPKRLPKDDSHTSGSPNTTKHTGACLESTSENGIGLLRCPHGELLALWDEVMPKDIRRHLDSVWRPQRAGYKNLRGRWADGFVTKKRNGESVLYTDLESGLSWWRKFFVYLTKSSFLMQQCRPFDLGWVVKKENFLKAIEGNWHD